MAHFNLPLRNRKDLARAAQLRSLTRPLQYGLDDHFFPPSNPSLWRREPNPRNMPFDPYYAGTNQLNQPTFLPNPTAPFDYPPAPYGSSPYTRRSNSYMEDTIPSSTTNTTTTKPPISFSKAARALHEALAAAEAFTHNLEQDFLRDTYQMRWYVDEATIAHLWKRLITWDGVPFTVEHDDSTTEPTSTTTPHQQTPSPTFTTHAHRVLRALETWQSASQLSAREWDSLRERGSVLREEDVTLVWRKLRVGCAALEELLGAVAGERRRCVALLRELASARVALEGVREVWDGGVGGVGKGREREREGEEFGEC